MKHKSLGLIKAMLHRLDVSDLSAAVYVRPMNPNLLMGRVVHNEVKADFETETDSRVPPAEMACWEG